MWWYWRCRWKFLVKDWMTPIFLVKRSEVGIYNRENKTSTKKLRWSQKESFFLFSWTLSWSRAACFLSLFFVFLIAFLVQFLFSYFLVFFYKFSPQIGSNSFKKNISPRPAAFLQLLRRTNYGPIERQTCQVFWKMVDYAQYCSVWPDNILWSNRLYL